MTVRASVSAAANVVAGWLGLEVPPIPKQRSKARAGYRKTTRRRAAAKERRQ